MVAVIEMAMEVAVLLDEAHTYAWLVEGKVGQQQTSTQNAIVKQHSTMVTGEEKNRSRNTP